MSEVFFLVEFISEPVDTTSGMTPFHDESGRTFTSYRFMRFATEEEGMAQIPRGNWAAPLRLRTGLDSTLLDKIKKALTEDDRVVRIFNQGNEIRSPNGRQLIYHKGHWTAREGGKRDRNFWYEIRLNRVDIVHIWYRVLGEVINLLELEMQEEELLEHNQQSLLDVYAILCGFAGKYRVYDVPKGVMILG